MGTEGNTNISNMEKELNKLQNEYNRISLDKSRLIHNRCVLDFNSIDSIDYTKATGYVYVIVYLISLVVMLLLIGDLYNVEALAIISAIVGAFFIVAILDTLAVVTIAVLNLLRGYLSISDKLEKLDKQLEDINNEIKTTEELIENTKAASIKPASIISKSKKSTVESMYDTVKSAEKEVQAWGHKYDTYKDRLLSILNNCKTLLDMCENDADAINDISNIYNVLISETLSVVKEYWSNTNEITNMLEKFERFTCTKLNKYRRKREERMKCSINTLNRLFDED